MFLLGEYYEDEARDIANRLKEVGMKVDIRTFTASRLELFHCLEGRMSVLKGELLEKDYARYERYLMRRESSTVRSWKAIHLRKSGWPEGRSQPV